MLDRESSVHPPKRYLTLASAALAKHSLSTRRACLRDGQMKSSGLLGRLEFASRLGAVTKDDAVPHLRRSNPANVLLRLAEPSLSQTTPQ